MYQKWWIMHWQWCQPYKFAFKMMNVCILNDELCINSRILPGSVGSQKLAELSLWPQQAIFWWFHTAAAWVRVENCPWKMMILFLKNGHVFGNSRCSHTTWRWRLSTFRWASTLLRGNMHTQQMPQFLPDFGSKFCIYIPGVVVYQPRHEFKMMHKCSPE